MRSKRQAGNLSRPPSLRQDVLATLATRAAWVALEFLAGVVLARLLGASGYGIYAMAMAVATVCGGTAALGFDRLLIREVAVLKIRADWSRLRTLLAASTRWVLAASCVMAAMVVVAAPWIAGRAGSPAANAIRIGALLIPAMAWSRQRQGAIQGLGRVALGLLPELLLQPLLLFTILGIALCLRRLPTAAGDALALQVVCAVIAGIAGTVLLRRHLPAPVRRASPTPVEAAWLRATAPFLVMLFTTLELGAVDTLLLGALRGAEQAGPYRAASQIAAFAAFPMTAINLAAAPRLAACHEAGDLAGLQRIARHALLGGVTAACLIATAFWLFGSLLLNLYGPGFDVAYGPLALLTGAYAIYTLSGISGYLLIMSKHASVTAWLFVVGTTVSIVAQLVLIPVWGAMGAAAATSLALCLLAVALTITARRLIGTRPAVIAT